MVAWTSRRIRTTRRSATSSADRRDGSMLAGVAAGLAEYFEVDATFVRIGLVALTLLGGAGVPLYVAAWLLIPEEGSEVAVAGEILGHSCHR